MTDTRRASQRKKSSVPQKTSKAGFVYVYGYMSFDWTDPKHHHIDKKRRSILINVVLRLRTWLVEATARVVQGPQNVVVRRYPLEAKLLPGFAQTHWS